MRWPFTKATKATATRVTLTDGELEGAETAGLYRFLGVPYAAPPLREKRWRAPEPPAPWEGVREAKQFSPIAMQTIGGQPSIQAAEQSEDCLYLNVWTSSVSHTARQPVMVWIHGGGNFGGSGSEDWCDGTALARRGITVVTFNYRLGAFGFLAHPTIGANFAVLDHVAALQWVKNNIAALGGDPDNVTIFGESAGAVAVRTLLSCPQARGLFHRGVIQSAGFEPPAFTPAWSYERATSAAERLMDRLGTRDPDALRLVPSEELKRASHEFCLIPPKPGQVHTPANLVWMPVPDGITVVDGAYPGWPDNVPLMFGCVENESRYFIRPVGAPQRPGIAPIDYTPDLLADMTATLCGSKADEVAALQTQSTESPYEKLDQIITTAIWTEPAFATAKRFAAMGRKFYYYHFSRVSPGARRSGELAQHSCEIRYVFGTLTADGAYDQTDASISQGMQEAWTTFARDGVPRSPDGHTWPAYDGSAPRMTWVGDVFEERAFEITPLAAIMNSGRPA